MLSLKKHPCYFQTIQNFEAEYHAVGQAMFYDLLKALENENILRIMSNRTYLYVNPHRRTQKTAIISFF